MKANPLRNTTTLPKHPYVVYFKGRFHSDYETQPGAEQAVATLGAGSRWEERK